MKRINILAYALLGVLFISSCVNMDTYPEGSTVTSEQKANIVKADPSKAAAGVNAIFAQFNQYMGVTGSRHNDIGYPSIMLFTDADGMDMVSQDNGYNWIGNGLDYADHIITSYETQIIWNTLYKMIYAANTVIAGIKDPQEPETKYNLAQGLAARAFEYWILAQLYQFNYADHKSSPCVPIVTDENSNDVAINGAARSTVEEVYAQIMSDLNKAVTYLDEAGIKPADKRYIAADVAYGLRARVNLTMENWSAAAADAQKAIEKAQARGLYPYTIAEASTPAFMDSKDHNFMWAIVVAETDRVVTSGIVNWPSHMGSFNYGYCWYAGGQHINKALFNTIPTTDARRGWWTDENCYSPNLTEEMDYVINSYVEYDPYVQVKFAPYKNEMYCEVNANDIPLMRVEEMYLIKAEAEAMQNQGAAAKNTIEGFVQTYRDPAYTFTASTQQAMRDEIWRQRRIELWGEGLSWYDIMRMKKDVDRRGCGYPDATSVLWIKSGDNALLWRLPEKEINANPALTEADNNPAVAKPTPVEDID